MSDYMEILAQTREGRLPPRRPQPQHLAAAFCIAVGLVALWAWRNAW